MEVIDGNVVRSVCAFPNADYVSAPSILQLVLREVLSFFGTLCYG